MDIKLNEVKTENKIWQKFMWQYHSKEMPQFVIYGALGELNPGGYCFKIYEACKYTKKKIKIKHW